MVSDPSPHGLLFSRGNLTHLMRRRRLQILDAISGADPKSILNSTSDELCVAMVARFRLDAPVLDAAGLALGKSAAPTSRSRVQGHSSATVDVSIPFAGDGALFGFHPGWYPVRLPKGTARKNLLQFCVPDDPAEPELKRSVDGALAHLNRFLAAIGAKADEFNAGLPEFVRDSLRARRDNIAAERMRLASTGYRLSPKPPAVIKARGPGTGLRFLVVATEWHSGHGGLSSFNREMCKALAAAGMEVVCLVLQASQSERQLAANNGVTIVEAVRTPGLQEKEALTRKPILPEGFVPDIIVGHGRITGPAAQVLKEDHFPAAKRLHFVHMAPDEVEWFKLDREDDAGERADRRTKVEIDLGRTADHVVAVGPRLHQRYLTEFHPYDISAPLRFDPGFGSNEPEAASVPPGVPWRILFLGRAEDDILKGLDLAAKAVGITARRREQNAARLQLTVRGASAENSEKLRSQLVEWSGNPGLDVVVRPFTTDTSSLEAEMNRASLVLMPSKSEGFGLVGLEAIAAGIPVLVSAESGLGELLREILGEEESRRTVIPVSKDLEHDASRWADTIGEELRDRTSSFARAAQIRETLATQKTWRMSIESLLVAVQGG